MEYTRLGSSGLTISRIATGTMSFGQGDSGRPGWPIPYEDAVPFFRQTSISGSHSGTPPTVTTLGRRRNRSAGR